MLDTKSGFEQRIAAEVDGEIAQLEGLVVTLRDFRAALNGSSAQRSVPAGKARKRKSIPGKNKKRGRPTNAEKAAREAAAALV